ncbi:MAG TPA: hypothetical protein VKT78_02590 [Fimbriimonadaceae bacterium]|nr:hypothetical protein [Fimbriimonadaceae bacterium]
MHRLITFSVLVALIAGTSEMAPAMPSMKPLESAFTTQSLMHQTPSRAILFERSKLVAHSTSELFHFEPFHVGLNPSHWLVTSSGAIDRREIDVEFGPSSSFVRAKD